ncbi:MAG: hypothetical protein RSH52_29060, partial [Janthinobacterium sp.]
MQLQEQHAAEKIGGQVVLKWHQSGQYHFVQKAQRQRRLARCPTGQAKKRQREEEKRRWIGKRQTSFMTRCKWYGGRAERKDEIRANGLNSLGAPEKRSEQGALPKTVRIVRL